MQGLYYVFHPHRAIEMWNCSHHTLTQQNQLPSPSLQREQLCPYTQVLQAWKEELFAAVLHQTAPHRTLKQIPPAQLKPQNPQVKQQWSGSTGQGRYLLLVGWPCQTKANNPHLGKKITFRFTLQLASIAHGQTAWPAVWEPRTRRGEGYSPQRQGCQHGRNSCSSLMNSVIFLTLLEPVGWRAKRNDLQMGTLSGFSPSVNLTSLFFLLCAGRPL